MPPRLTETRWTRAEEAEAAYARICAENALEDERLGAERRIAREVRTEDEASRRSLLASQGLDRSRSRRSELVQAA